MCDVVLVDVVVGYFGKFGVIVLWVKYILCCGMDGCVDLCVGWFKLIL